MRTQAWLFRNKLVRNVKMVMITDLKIEKKQVMMNEWQTIATLNWEDSSLGTY